MRVLNCFENMNRGRCPCWGWPVHSLSYIATGMMSCLYILNLFEFNWTFFGCVYEISCGCRTIWNMSVFHADGSNWGGSGCKFMSWGGLEPPVFWAGLKQLWLQLMLLQGFHVVAGDGGGGRWGCLMGLMCLSRRQKGCMVGDWMCWGWQWQHSHQQGGCQHCQPNQIAWVIDLWGCPLLGVHPYRPPLWFSPLLLGPLTWLCLLFLVWHWLIEWGSPPSFHPWFWPSFSGLLAQDLPWEWDIIILQPFTQ